MAAILAFLLTLLLMVAAVGIAAFFCYTAYVLPTAVSNVFARFEQRFADHQQRDTERTRRTQIEEEIRSRMHGAALGSSVDRTLLQASEETRRISIALNLTRDSMKTCCEIQLFTAQVQGAEEMSEIEWDPLCASLRQSVMDHIDVALDRLVAYPVMDSTLLKKSIGMQAMREICLECELLRYRVADAPALCSPARFMGGRPEKNHANDKNDKAD